MSELEPWCQVAWYSHACDLSAGHDGGHLCLLIADAGDDDSRWIWADQGDVCNFWDGKEIVFLFDVCSQAGPDSPEVKDTDQWSVGEWEQDAAELFGTPVTGLYWTYEGWMRGGDVVGAWEVGQ